MSEYLPAHFHFSGEWIQAEVGRNAGQAVSSYMQRASAGIKVSNYMDRSRAVDDEFAQKSEVAHYFLYTNGLDIDAKALWAANDQLNRNRHGEYKTHAGKLPRLGIFVTASLPYGTSKEDAIAAAERFAQALIDKYGCAVEGVIHYKDGQYDHAHFAIIDRKVGPEGISKTKIRELNGVAAKAEGRGIQDKGKYLAPAMEFMRSTWAAETCRISENPRIDHRSFWRQGIDLRPVAYVPRGEIEFQKRHGQSDWRENRERELMMRDASRAAPIMIPLAAAARKRPPVQTFGILAAAKILSAKMAPAAAIAVAQSLGRLTPGRSAAAPALLAWQVADQLNVPTRVPTAQVPPPLILPRPPRKRQPAETLGAAVAAKLLSQHMGGAAAIKVAGVLGRMTQGRSAVATALIAKVVADRLQTPTKAPIMEVPAPFLLPRPPRKQQPDQTLGVGLAAKLLGRHMGGAAAIKVAGALGRMTQGRTGLATALLAKAIADRLQAAEKAPTIEVAPPLIMPRPPRKRQPAQTLGVGLAAKLLGRHMGGAAAIKVAGALGRMTQGRSALATALTAKLLADRIAPPKPPEAERPRPPAADVRPSRTFAPSNPHQPQIRPTPAPPPAADRVAPPMYSAPAALGAGLIRPLAAVLSQPGSSLVPRANISIRQAAAEQIKTKREADRNTFYDIDEIMQRVDAGNRATRLRLIAEDEERLRQSQIKTLAENDKLRRQMAAALKPEFPIEPNVDRSEASLKRVPPPSKPSPQIPMPQGPTPRVETSVPLRPSAPQASPPTPPKVPLRVAPQEQHVRIASQYAAFLIKQHKRSKDYMQRLAHAAGIELPDLERRAATEYQSLFVKGGAKPEGFGKRLKDEAAKQGFTSFVKVYGEINADLLAKHEQAAARLQAQRSDSWEK